jgi:AcrR family transcriptional regulator
MAARRKLRKVQILEAAVAVIGDRGLCDTRIADVAARAGASSALVIYYFESKDRLLAQALAFSEERFYSQTATELGAIHSARDQMVRLIEMSCSQGRTDRNWLDEWLLWLDLWALSPRDPVVAKDREAMDRRWRETIAGIVRLGQERGEFAAVDPDDFSVRLAALIDGLAIQVVLGDPEVDSRRMFDMCIALAAEELGFEAPPPPRRRPSPKARARRNPSGPGSGSAAAARPAAGRTR